MAGTVTGSIDHRLGDGTGNAPHNNSDLFIALLNYLASKYTTVATNWGSGGTGFDLWDGTNPVGENAWACFRAASAANPFDVFIQWADSVPFGTAPGSPGALKGGTLDGVGITIAFREDGSDPWNGGTGSLGSDTKGATVWSAGGSTLHVLDVANTAGGSFATNKQNTVLLQDLSTGIYNRFHVVGDDDGFLCLVDAGDEGNYNGCYFGAYAPRAGTLATIPLVAVEQASETIWVDGTGTTYGTSAGSSSFEGGLLGGILADGVGPLSIHHQGSSIFQTVLQPNSQISPAELDGIAVGISRRVTNQGYIGTLPTGLVSLVYNVSNLQTNAAATRAFIGFTTVAATKWSIPWDGGAAPGVGTSRTGRQF